MHDVNLEGPSGILRTADPVPKWVGYKRRLEWPTGAQCVYLLWRRTAESLRGHQTEMMVIDEIA
jgi:phage terminase large subunit-like protein